MSFSKSNVNFQFQPPNLDPGLIDRYPDAGKSLESLFNNYLAIKQSQNAQKLQDLQLRSQYGGVNPLTDLNDEQRPLGLAGPTITPAQPATSAEPNPQFLQQISQPYGGQVIGQPSQDPRQGVQNLIGAPTPGTPAVPEQAQFHENPIIATLQRHVQTKREWEKVALRKATAEATNLERPQVYFNPITGEPTSFEHGAKPLPGQRGGVFGAAQLNPNAVEAAANAVLSGHANLTDFPGFGANSMRAQVTAKVFEKDGNYDIAGAATGRTFGQGQARFASSGQIEGPLTYMKSVIPNMDHLQTLSDKLDKGRYPIINRATLSLMTQSGDPNAVAFATATTEVADQVAKILQGGGSGSSTSDAKLKQAVELFDKGYSPEQMAAVIREIKGLLSNRVTALESVQSKFKKQAKQGAEGAAPAGGSGKPGADPLGLFN